MPIDYDVIVIGAGPSGAISSALLVKRGYKVLVLEREVFPRFSIGESLLPQCMEYIEEAGMLEAVQAGNFQYKNGACFNYQGKKTAFDFQQKFTEGWSDTFQVKRAEFDKILADEAEKQGVEIRYQHEIIGVNPGADVSVVEFKNAENEVETLRAKFILDASGFGRVLPRLLDLGTPSDFPVRQSIFTHIQDNIDVNVASFDRHKIAVTVHPKHRDVWIWLIPFNDNTCSIGAVAEESFFERYAGEPLDILKQIISEDKELNALLSKAVFHMPVRKITGYSANVQSLYGDGYALLGNAGEFLDPVFSSGVTIAMRSASMAAELLDTQFKGGAVDWQAEFSDPLKQGVNAFRTYVEGWYDKSFQDVLFHHEHLANVKSMICSILAGYAWDESNPYVKNSKRRLSVLAEICLLNEEEAEKEV